MKKKDLTIALSKGRILNDTLPILAECGITLKDDPLTSRKLQFETNLPNVKIIIVRATDVPTFVSHGAADIGISGKDILLEGGYTNLFELVDLKISTCKLMVAVKTEFAEQYKNYKNNVKLKVATKFVHLAKNYFSNKNQSIELIKLYGSMELAPLVNLSDCIVDIVDTGNTLKANGLIPVEKIIDVSSRVIVSKSSWVTKYDELKPIIDGFESYANNIDDIV